MTISAEGAPGETFFALTDGDSADVSEADQVRMRCDASNQGQMSEGGDDWRRILSAFEVEHVLEVQVFS